MNNVEEIAWLAGLLEGEGHFGHYKHSDIVSLRMCDEDVVARVAEIMSKYLGWPVEVREHIPPIATRQRVYYVQLYGKRARTIMRLIVNLMCERRQTVINALLEKRTLKTELTLGALDANNSDS